MRSVLDTCIYCGEDFTNRPGLFHHEAVHEEMEKLNKVQLDRALLTTFLISADRADVFHRGE